MSSPPVRTPAEVLDALRKMILEHQDARALAIHVFGWACGVCVAAGVSLDECAGFLQRYKNEEYEKKCR
jgi:hypothetical protein